MRRRYIFPLRRLHALDNRIELLNVVFLILMHRSVVSGRPVQSSDQTLYRDRITSNLRMTKNIFVENDIPAFDALPSSNVL